VEAHVFAQQHHREQDAAEHARERRDREARAITRAILGGAPPGDRGRAQSEHRDRDGGGRRDVDEMAPARRRVEPERLTQQREHAQHLDATREHADADVVDAVAPTLRDHDRGAE
jgi:hypothetical protein